MIPQMLGDCEQFSNELENLEILAEECAEVSQIKSKIVRFGLDDYHPKNEIPNRQALERELGHIIAMIDILVKHETITMTGVLEGRRHKLKKLGKWYGGNHGQNS